MWEHFLELTALEADFFRADIVMDRDELMANIPQDHIHATVLGCMLTVLDTINGLGWTFGMRPDCYFRIKIVGLKFHEMPEDVLSGDVVLVTLSWDSVTTRLVADRS